MKVRAFLLAVLALAACGSPAEREARDLRRLRERAAAGIEAVERFCSARDSAIAHVQRGGPDVETLLEEVLLTPVVLDDYCEDFRFHEHDEESDESEPDTMAADSTKPPGR